MRVAFPRDRQLGKQGRFRAEYPHAKGMHGTVPIGIKARLPGHEDMVNEPQWCSGWTPPENGVLDLG